MLQGRKSRVLTARKFTLAHDSGLMNTNDVLKEAANASGTQITRSEVAFSTRYASSRICERFFFSTLYVIEFKKRH